MAGSYAKKGATPSKGYSGTRQSSIKRNSSILSFFQKTDTPPGATSRQARITQFATATSQSPSSGRGTQTFQRRNNTRNDTAGGLFLEDKKGLAKIERATSTSERERSLTPDFWGDDDEFLKRDAKRYNESDTAVKRRKVDSPDSPATETQQPETESKTEKAPTPTPAKTQKRSGPFIDESDSEDDMEAYRELDETTPTTRDMTNEALHKDKIVATERTSESTPPPLVSAATNNADNDEYANFDVIEDEDELIGEEFRNRPWEGEEQDHQIDLEVDPDKVLNDCSGIEDIEGEVSTCPICQMVLKDLNETVSAYYFPSGVLKY